MSGLTLIQELSCAGHMASMRIMREIGRDAKEIVLPVGFAFENVGSSEEAIVGLLQKVVGQLGVSGAAPQKDPQRARGSLVHSGERVLIHLKGLVGFKGPCLQPVEFGIGQVHA